MSWREYVIITKKNTHLINEKYFRCCYYQQQQRFQHDAAINSFLLPQTVTCIYTSIHLYTIHSCWYSPFSFIIWSWTINTSMSFHCCSIILGLTWTIQRYGGTWRDTQSPHQLHINILVELPQTLQWCCTNNKQRSWESIKDTQIISLDQALHKSAVEQNPNQSPSCRAFASKPVLSELPANGTQAALIEGNDITVACEPP